MSTAEALLLKRFISNGDSEAFAEIVKQQASLVYGVCLRILEDKDKAADAVQETFLQLVRDANNISGSLSNWLHRVATHRAIDMIRQDAQRKQHELQYASNSRKVQSEQQDATWKEISGYIDQEINNLDEQMRDILIMRYFESLTTIEIAAKYGISHPTVCRRLESGVVSLRHKLRLRGIITPATVLAVMLNENIVKAVPANIMKELGKIALLGSPTTATLIGANVGRRILTEIADKAKIIATAAVITVLVGSAATYYNSNQQTKAKESLTQKETVKTLLDKYAQTRNKFNSFTGKTENTIELEINPTSSGSRFEYSHLKNYNKIEFRYDGTKVSRCEHLWGDINTVLTNVTENDPYYRSIFYNDNLRLMIRYLKSDKNDLGRVEIDKEVKQKLAEQTLARGYKGHEILGYIEGDDERFDFILKNLATDISVRGKTEDVNGSQCYVIDAETKKGKYVIWLDPAHGYNIAKAEVTRTGGNLRNGNDPPIKTGDKEYRSMSNVKFRQIDGIWIPVEADIYYNYNLTAEFGYTYWEKIHHKVIDFKINPDHDALGSFRLDDIPNGATVRFIDSLNTPYTWNDGKVVDSSGVMKYIFQR
jgi:RNA polymerase sigma factor (sigma-70 family)